jgi:hypothetical protein
MGKGFRVKDLQQTGIKSELKIFVLCINTRNNKTHQRNNIITRNDSNTSLISERITTTTQNNNNEQDSIIAHERLHSKIKNE